MRCKIDLVLHFIFLYLYKIDHEVNTTVLEDSEGYFGSIGSIEIFYGKSLISKSDYKIPIW